MSATLPPHSELFNRLQDATSITALIGTTEHLHLDCKIWPTKDDDAQKLLAKALSGFANADGGVIVIGMQARRGPDKDDPDVIEKPVPVSDTVAVKSRVEDLIGQIVEPRIQGVTLSAVPECPGAKTGFVVINVPATDGFPCRSRKDWKFYQRISAGTFPMEYFQIADMFGKRRGPVLKLYIEEGKIKGNVNGVMDRMFTIGIENRGRGVAKFPSLRFKRISGITLNSYGLDGNFGFGLPLRPSDPEWIVFGGGVDHVIYPASVLKIALLEQSEKRITRTQVEFEEFAFTVELAADEVACSEDAGYLPKRTV